MARVLHIIDGSTSLDMLDQLQLLARAEDAVFSVGPPPRRPSFSLPIRPFHKPMDSPALCGWRMRRMADGVSLVHAWSLPALRAAEVLCWRRPIHLLRSLGFVPGGDELARLLKAVRAGRLHLSVPTQAAKRGLLAAGADEGRIHVLPTAAEPAENLPARRASARAALHLADDEFLLAAPAEMTRAAGHKYASWAHAIVRQLLPNIRLLLPGGGPNEPHVRFFAHTTGYDAEVFLTGDRLGRHDVLAAADAALFFFERDGGLSALLAAMAAGLPVAASRTPDIVECTGDGKAALLADPADPRSASAAVLRLCEDAKLARSLGKAARTHAARSHAPAAVRAALATLYEAVARNEVV